VCVCVSCTPVVRGGGAKEFILVVTERIWGPGVKVVVQTNSWGLKKHSHTHTHTHTHTDRHTHTVSGVT